MWSTHSPSFRYVLVGVLMGLLTPVVPAQSGSPPPSITAGVSDTADDMDGMTAGDDDDLLQDLADLDLAQLLKIKVTSVAGREQALIDTPAALFVITPEDIRRSGHRSIAEALRMVPGYHVGQISPSLWSVGSRGLGDRFANDLLVLIDGRTVYDPLFSGVFWNVQDVMMEDLERIEVIRGPGATLWGANAVNGVVNVTTKSSRDTQGLLITGGAGSEAHGFGAVRYGGQIDDDTHFRVWTKYDNVDDFKDPAGGVGRTDWNMFRGGFRIDRLTLDDLELTLQGEAYGTGHSNASVRVPIPGHLTTRSDTLEERYQGGNVLFRAGHTGYDDDGWSVQAYYDRTETRAGVPGFEVRRHTLDIDYRQYGPLADGRQILMWGLGYRHTRDQTSPGETVSFDPSSRSLDTFSAFIQDTIALIPDELALMIGSKFEHNDFTGFEYQPSARLSWTPDTEQTMWGAVSRAVRTPSRIADDATLITAYGDTGLIAGGAATGIFVPLSLRGDTNVESEELLALELGYRRRIGDSISVDVAGFYNDYDDLITFPIPAGTFGNRGDANTYGVEVAATWHVADNWRLAGAYSFLRIDFDSVDGNAEERESPQQQFNLRSHLDLTDDLELNTSLYYVDTVPDERASSYTRLDLGMTWRPEPGIEIAVWGLNLLDPRHFEFGDDLFQDAPLEVERSIYGQITFRF